MRDWIASKALERLRKAAAAAAAAAVFSFYSVFNSLMFSVAKSNMCR